MNEKTRSLTGLPKRGANKLVGSPTHHASSLGTMRIAEDISL